MDSRGRGAWSNTVRTAFTALSRWRHGFESRWGCHKKLLVTGPLALWCRPESLELGVACQSCANLIGPGRGQA
jgi:hypothetical protein